MPAATVVMFDVFTDAFKYAVVVRSADDYEVVVKGGKTSEEHKRLFASRAEAVKREHEGKPTLEQIGEMLVYNMSFLADTKMFDDPGEALRFAQEIAGEAPTADDYGKRQ